MYNLHISRELNIQFYNHTNFGRCKTVMNVVGLTLMFYNHANSSRCKTCEPKLYIALRFTTMQILVGVKHQIIILHICMVLASDINTLIYFKQNAFTSTSSPLGRKIALTYYKICILFLFLINKII